jgi:hypothetical protein
MTEFTPFESFSTFHVPEFDIAIEGADPDSRLRFDVIDVTYTDSMDAFDSFEFSLADWDPVRLEPVYSSPWDEDGNVKTYSTSTGDTPIPILEPGTVVSLSMYYRDDNVEDFAKMEPHLMLRGRVASLSTAFPASGVPVAKVRVLSPLAWLGRKKLTGSATGGLVDVIEEVCDQIELNVDTSGIPAEILSAEQGQDAPETDLDKKDANEVLKDAIIKLGLGSHVAYDETTEDETLVLAAPPEFNLSLNWGRTLVSFSPTVSTTGLSKTVKITVEDPTGASEEEQRFDVEKGWDDLTGLKRDVLGPDVLDGILKELPDEPETITEPTRHQLAFPEQAALNRLREQAMGIVTGSGQTVGLPQLKKGARVELLGLGAKFSGVYEVTKSTHSIGASGYSTTFNARKEIFDA